MKQQKNHFQGTLRDSSFFSSGFLSILVQGTRCDITPSCRPRTISISLNQYYSWPVTHLVVSAGVSHISYGGARGVMVIIAGSGHGDTRSNPGRD